MNTVYKNEDFFQLFGHVSVFFATLDLLVTLTILRLIRLDGQVKDITMSDQTTLQQKFRLIEKLRADQVNDPKLLSELQALMPTALVIGERRNRFIHDQWRFGTKDVSEGKISRLRIRELAKWKFVIKQEEVLSIEELHQFLCDIGMLQKQFGQFLERLESVEGS